MFGYGGLSGDRRLWEVVSCCKGLEDFRLVGEYTVYGVQVIIE